MRSSGSQPALVELASGVSHQSRYYFLLPDQAKGRGLRVLYGGFEQCLPDYRIARANFPHHCLEVIVGGQGEVEVDGAWIEMREGSVFLYRPGRPWRMRGAGSEGLRKFFVVFDGLDLRATDPARAGRMPFHFEPLWELVLLLEALEREARHPSDERQSICNCLFEAILRKLRARESYPDVAGVSSRSRQTYLTAVRYIEEHFRELRSGGQIAERVGVDASYLCRLFQRYSGMSPHRYLTRLRMQYAMTLLTREGLSVTAVAEMLGFQNPFHFSRVFKTAHGFPPSACFRTATAQQTGGKALGEVTFAIPRTSDRRI